jgi:segregation and condensation protein B
VTEQGSNTVEEEMPPLAPEAAPDDVTAVADDAVADDHVADDAAADDDAADGAVADDAIDDAADDAAAAADDAAPVGELTEAQLEALLFVAEKPLTRREIGMLAGVDRATVDERLGDLEVSLAGRGIRLLVVGDRVELATAPEAGALVARYVGADAVRLSPAALETLAIIAYRQPVTRAAIERVRGVDSDYSVRALLHRRLVVEQGRSEAPGRPILYGTGFEFLERFGLTSLDDMPPLDLEVAARLVDGDASERSSARPAAADVEGPLGADA